MYTKHSFVYTSMIDFAEEDNRMATGRARSHKHFRLDPVKIKRAQRVLRAGTETEAIERALDLVISEHERNRLAAEANERFVASGIDIKDVYGTLEE
jgi:hypothetical protein